MPLGETGELCRADEDELLVYHRGKTAEQLDELYGAWLKGMSYKEVRVDRSGPSVRGRAFAVPERRLSYRLSPVPHDGARSVRLSMRRRSGGAVVSTADRKATRERARARAAEVARHVAPLSAALSGEAPCAPEQLPSSASHLPHHTIDLWELQRIAKGDAPKPTTRIFRNGTARVCRDLEEGGQRGRLTPGAGPYTCAEELNQASPLLILWRDPERSRNPVYAYGKSFTPGVFLGQLVVYDPAAQRVLCHAPVRATSSAVVGTRLYKDSRSGKGLGSSADVDVDRDFYTQVIAAQKKSLQRIAAPLVQRIRWSAPF